MSRYSFLESTLKGFTRAVSKALQSEHAATQPGLLQQLDPRVRVIGILALVIAVILCRRLEAIAAILLIAIGIAAASRVRLTSLAIRVWLVVLGFSGVIALPALFITPGEPLATWPALHLSITVQGVRTAVLLVLRVETAATLTTVLVLSTAWTHILKALRSLHLPAEVVTMMAMTHRYVFLLIETANQMFESRQSRTVGVLSGSEQRKNGGSNRRSAAQQEHRTQPGGVSCHVVAGFSRRGSSLDRFPFRTPRLCRPDCLPPYWRR